MAEDEAEEMIAEQTPAEEQPGDGEQKKKKESLLKQAIKDSIKETKEQLRSVFKRKKKEEAQQEKKKRLSLKDFVQKRKEKITLKDHIKNIYQVERKVIVEYDKPTVVSWIKNKSSKIKNRVPVEDLNRTERINRLKKEIFDDLKRKPMAEVLPKAIELSVLTGRQEDTKWMLRELFGYFNAVGSRTSIKVDKKDTPGYRKIDAYLELRLHDGSESPSNDELLIPFFYLRPIGWLEDELERYSKDEVKEVKVTTFLPQELSMMKKYLGNQPVFLRLSVSQLKTLQTEVKFRIDSFVSTLD